MREVHLIATNYGPLGLRPSTASDIRTSPPPPRDALRDRGWRILTAMTIMGAEDSAFDPDSIIDLQTHQMLVERAQHWRNAAQALRERHPPTER